LAEFVYEKILLLLRYFEPESADALESLWWRAVLEYLWW